METVTTLKKVHELLDIESRSLSTIEEQLDEMKKGTIRRLFGDSFEKEQYKLKREKLEGQIKSKSAFIENEKSKLENASFCDVDVLTSFITRTLNIIEEETYDQWDFTLEMEECDIVRLIAPKYICEKIARLCCVGEIYDMSDMEELDEDDNEIGLILFELCDDYDVTNIYDAELQDVPEEYDSDILRNMLLRLVELKYKNPALSDEEVAEEVIRQIATEHSSSDQKDEVKTYKKCSQN